MEKSTDLIKLFDFENCLCKCNNVDKKITNINIDIRFIAVAHRHTVVAGSILRFIPGIGTKRCGRQDINR